MSTISAIATALGNKGINIIRISGDESLKIVKDIFSNYEKLKPNNIVYGNIIYHNNVIDNVLVSYFKAPYSFTGEDIIEINCHGGTLITQKILDIVLENGAILATPGEFSKRAFLNGKMDLSEAESVINLINAKTSIEAKIATSNMTGDLFVKIKNLREKIIEMLAQIEVSVDYPEYDYEQVQNEELDKLLKLEINEIDKLINSYDEGKYIKNGINVAILGKPNVGKSSLLNSLAGSERAIVTDIAGTTRDTIDETINIGDVILNITDTAGIRDTEDVIEKMGVERSLKKIEEVDLIIYIFNASEKITKEDKNTISKIQNKGVKIIYVINKMDEVIKEDYDGIMEELKHNDSKTIVNMSVKNNIGMGELKTTIKKLFFNDEIFSSNEIVIVNQRHKELLKKCNMLLNDVKEQLKKDIPIDIISIKLKESAKNLGEIIGSDVNSDVINKIFEKFCLGK